MKVIILCGGMGTRLREETEYKPKPMVKVGDKPILWHIMKHYAYYGHKEFVLALGYKGNIIRDYFLNYYNYNSDFTVDLSKVSSVQIHNNRRHDDWKVTLVETGTDSMTGYRVKLCFPFIQEDRFMLTYGDAVSNVDIGKLEAFSVRMNTMGTVTGVNPPSRFGDLITEDGIVTSFKQQLKEISAQNTINGGYFVFKKEFFNYLPDDPGCSLEDEPMDRLAKERQLSVYSHTDFWQCMDTYRDYQLLNTLWSDGPPWRIWNEERE